MIIYDLSCENGHSFEGWFQSQPDFDDQQVRGLISCPNCGSTEIRRVPSAVHVGKGEKYTGTVIGQAEQTTARVAPVPSTDGVPEDALNAMRRLVSMITEKCEDVGERFAEEARKIHYAEAPERPIRGEVSREEFHELHEEGIDVFIMPHIKNSTLM